MLDDVTQWLRVSLRMQVTTGALLSKAEQLVGSPGNTGLPSAHLESHGDAWFSQYGGALTENFLENIVSFDTRWSSSHTSPPCSRKFADVLVGFMMSNVGFGPLAAHLLHLQTLFTFFTRSETECGDCGWRV